MGELHHNGVARDNSSTNGHAGSASGCSSAAGYRVRSSRLLKVINWWHCAEVYFPTLLRFVVVVLISQLVHDAWSHKTEIKVG